MKKQLRILLGLVVVLALLTSACSSGDSEEAAPPPSTEAPLPAPAFADGTTMKRIQDAGRIKIGVKFDQPGFGLRSADGAQPEGFDIQIAHLMAQGIFGGTKAQAAERIDYVETVSGNRERFVQEGRVDMVVAAYPISDTRAQFVDFAGPYYTAKGDLMVRSDDNITRSISDLNGKKVCVVRNSSYQAPVRAFAPQATMVELDTYQQCADALRDGRADAVATDNVILAGLVQTSSSEFKLLNASFADDPYGIGIRKGDTDFRSFLNQRLQTIIDNGKWREAFDATLGELNLPVPEPPEIEQVATTTTSLPTQSNSPTTTAAAP